MKSVIGITTISPIRYEVEIHDPLSTPVPMPPSMLSSEALVIWMFRIAMKAPIMAASTAIQVTRLARSELAELDMTRSLKKVASGNLARFAGSGGPRLVRPRPGLDGRGHRHAGTQVDRGVVAVERDLDRDALHHLGEIAGGVV